MQVSQPQIVMRSTSGQHRDPAVLPPEHYRLETQPERGKAEARMQTAEGTAAITSAATSDGYGTCLGALPED